MLYYGTETGSSVLFLTDREFGRCQKLAVRNTSAAFQRWEGEKEKPKRRSSVIKSKRGQAVIDKWREHWTRGAGRPNERGSEFEEKILEKLQKKLRVSLRPLWADESRRLLLLPLVGWSWHSSHLFCHRVIQKDILIHPMKFAQCFGPVFIQHASESRVNNQITRELLLTLNYQWQYRKSILKPYLRWNVNKCHLLTWWLTL